jgi:hypothetical protein
MVLRVIQQLAAPEHPVWVGEHAGHLKVTLVMPPAFHMLVVLPSFPDEVARLVTALSHPVSAGA